MGDSLIIKKSIQESITPKIISIPTSINGTVITLYANSILTAGITDFDTNKILDIVIMLSGIYSNTSSYSNYYYLRGFFFNNITKTGYYTEEGAGSGSTIRCQGNSASASINYNGVDCTIQPSRANNHPYLKYVAYVTYLG